MFEFGTLGELLVIAVAVLILFGPKEIPTVLKFLGKVTYRVKQSTYELKSYLNAFMREGEAEALSKDLEKTTKSSSPENHLNETGVDDTKNA